MTNQQHNNKQKEKERKKKFYIQTKTNIYTNKNKINKTNKVFVHTPKLK